MRVQCALFVAFAMQTTHVGAATVNDIVYKVRSEKASQMVHRDVNQVTVPNTLLHYASRDSAEGPRNRVLNLMQSGVAAIEYGEVDYALPLLQAAYELIETIYADDPNAAKARSLWIPEATKDFKGDAYERSMVGYYLGLAYMQTGDLENARASFKWGEFQDTMSASQKFQEDLALHRYLKAWSLQCQGGADNTAAEEFSAAKAIRADLRPPAPGDNVLVIVETGNAPTKHTAGKYNEILSYRRGATTPTTSVGVRVGEVQARPVLAENVYLQASTLGGRAVDKILAGKASFKDNAETTADVAAGVGTASMEVASILAASGSQNDALNAMGFGFLATMVSAGASAVAEEVKPHADARYWSSLPDQVHMTTMKYTNTESGTAHFFGATGWENKVETFSLRKTGNCYLGWTREVWHAKGNSAVQSAVWTQAAPASAPLSNDTEPRSTGSQKPPPPVEEMNVIVTF